MLNGKRMVSFSMVKNEEDIIEQFVRHNSKHIDVMYIADNMSTDGTRDILNALREEGLPIVIWDDNDPRHIQSEKTTAAYHKISSVESFHYFIAIDADEFIQLSVGCHIPEGKGNAFHLKRYCHVIDSTASTHDLYTMRQRLRKQQTPKILIVHDPKHFSEYTIADGNHFVEKAGRRVEHNELSKALIAHYPYRTIDQYVRKVVMGWLGVLLIDEEAGKKKECIASHWRDEYSILKGSNFNVDDDEIIPRIYGYSSMSELMSSCEPYDGVCEIINKYDPLMRNTKLQSMILTTCETIIDELWKCKGKVVLLSFRPSGRFRRLLMFYRRHGLINTILKFINK